MILPPGIKGVDVSSYQGINPDPLSTPGIRYAFIKATEGTAVDPTYSGHLSNARHLGLPVCAYHYNSPAASITAQVAAFLMTAGNVDGYALDVEGNQPFTEAGGREFIDRVHAAGKRIGMYHSEYGFPDWGQDWDWVANYDAQPARRWDVWQYGSYGPNLDGDIYRGTTGSLVTLWKGTMANTFFYRPDTKLGVVVVTQPGHYYQRLIDSVMHGPIDPATFGTHRAIGPVDLATPIAGGAVGADRKTAYIVGVEAAAFLATDVSFTADSVVADCTKPIADAIVADRAKAKIVYG